MARASSLEDSAREFASRIAAALPAGQAASCEVRNLSSLQPDDVARIERVLKTELPACDARAESSSEGRAAVIVTLSENWKGLVWTGEIRRLDVSRTVVFAVPRAGEGRPAPNAMHVTVRSERFWDGPERILDAAEVSGGNGKSWLVSLLDSHLAIQDLQTGSSEKLALPPAEPISRDPWGRLDAGKSSSVIWFAAGSRICKVDLETRSSPDCLSGEELNRPLGGRIPILIDIAPAGPKPPGKGLELEIAPVCGGTNQFLASSGRDYTQSDSLQVFQMEPNGPLAMSGELDFPGPILALHIAPDAPRAIVRNLTTGNYEAYRLDISCGQ